MQQGLGERLCVCVSASSQPKHREIGGGHMAGGDLFQQLANFPAIDSMGKSIGTVANDDHMITALGNRSLTGQPVTTGCWNSQNSSFVQGSCNLEHC